jgi:hypothetical protein
MRALTVLLVALLLPLVAEASFTPRLTTTHLRSPLAALDATYAGSGGGAADGMVNVGLYTIGGGIVAAAIGWGIIESFTDGMALLIGFSVLGLGAVAIVLGAVIWGIGAIAGGGGDAPVALAAPATRAVAGTFDPLPPVVTTHALAWRF